MKVYYVDLHEQHYYATLDEAKKAAREATQAGAGETARVERLNVATDRTSFVAALNGVVGVGEVVYTAKRRS